jgi:hypothetical protein
MRYKPLSSPTNTVRPLTREEREENALARIEFRRQAAAAAAAEAEARSQQVIERLNAIAPNGVRGLDRRDYARAKREALAALRSGGRGR